MKKIDRHSPLPAYVKERYPLTRSDSTKEIWHITLSLNGEKLDFTPGDSIGIYPQNDPTLVSHLIEALGASAGDLIKNKRSEEMLSLTDFLTHHANLSRITSSFLKLLDQHVLSSQKQGEIHSLLAPENKQLLRSFLSECDPLKLLREYTQKKVPLQEFCDQLGPLLPRFYSIASSSKKQSDEIDLTVALFTWEQSGEKRFGVASHFLCHLAEAKKTPVPIFVQPAPHFRLPTDHSTPIIMVGPGTGIAPFRAFMQERDHHEADGDHWLFFGERNAASDFYYEDEWKGYENLKLHTAFSRDQTEKTYVQHKMLKEAEKLYEWLESGAHLYVCGDAKQMAKDVDKALVQIISEQGKMNPDEAKAHLKSLKKQGRYLLDVY